MTRDTLYLIAEPQGGYFTTAQARDFGVSRQQLYHHAQAGTIDRVSHGIYRLRAFPVQRFEDVIAACLWAGDDAAASHETALAVYGLGDVMPSRIHITVPRPFRGRRKGVIVHHAPLEAGERTVRDSVPVTSVERTLADVAEASDPSLVLQALEEALNLGLASRRRLSRALEGRRLASEILAPVVHRK